MKLVIAAVLVACLGRALARSGGAPAEACGDLRPQHGGTAQANPSNYRISLTAFEGEGSGNETLGYIPGSTYTISFSNIAGGTYRGFFIQARDESGDVVGTFADPTTNPNARLSSCTPANGGVTHVNPSPRTDFSDAMSFMWTAPSDSAGPIRFHYSSVRVFDTYWVDERTEFISPVLQPTPTATPAPTPVAGGSSSVPYASLLLLLLSMGAVLLLF